MKTHFLFCFPFLIGFVFGPICAPAQDFDYGVVSIADLSMKEYAGDTSASAVVLKEFGTASIKNGDGYELIYKYHVRIKILDNDGLGQANIEIPLYKQDNNRLEKLVALKASSFNIENDRVYEEVLLDKNVFTDDRSKYLTVKKFAIPNVRVGSVIEVAYTLESPFIFNFREWEFQSDIPKMESSYWASLPGVYLYNITLRGFLKLTQNEASVKKNCLGSSNPLSGGSADCALRKFGMKDIPAFVEEDYMTAKKNFLSAIRFELSEIRHLDGRIDKITKEWKDAEDELSRDQRFGVQLRRGKDIGEEVKDLVAGETDPLTRARKVYDFVKGWYVWNETYGKYSEFGIRKAFEERKGNVGDINLSLIAALRFAGLDAEPVILSTRSNGHVVEVHPVLSDFNYVVAKVNIGEAVYLADATEKLYPFGMLPERCLNGKGRVLGERQSSWIDLKPVDANKTVSMLSLTLGPDGVMKGALHSTFAGYEGVRKRREIFSHSTQEEYIKHVGRRLDGIRITGFELGNVADVNKPVTRRLDIEIEAFDQPLASNTLFNPFIFDKWEENPFKSRERLYPVDFGVPIETVMVLHLAYPEGFDIVNVPEKIGMALPNSGGRYLLEAKNSDHKLALTSSLSIKKTLYSPEEYHYLKELFNRILQVQNAALIFRKKT